jgi:ankyrin repeat protein
MGTEDDKRRLLKLARKGPFDGDGGFKAQVQKIVDAGVRPEDYVDYADKRLFNRSPLWEATWKNNDETVKLLLSKKATVDFPDYQQRTPLHEAAYFGHINLVELFLNNGHPVDPVDCFGQTPLFRATEAGRHEVVEMLVERKAQLNLLDQDSVTAQHCASFQGMPDMSDWLYYRGSYKNQCEIKEKKSRPGEEAAGAAGEPSSPTSPTSPTVLPMDEASPDETMKQKTPKGDDSTGRKTQLTTDP